MKKYLILFIVTVLILSLAACGGKTKDDAKTDETGTAVGEPGPAADVQTDDPDDLAAQREKLIGEWYATDWPPVILTFGEDGSGVFSRQEGGTCAFTFEMYDYHEFNSGDEYMMHISYETGEAEDIIFWFNDNDTLGFHTSEHGGYCGVMYFSQWARSDQQQ
ncbi:MAG: hypothetical protein J5822_08325 [Eubacteriaceae bacterium]|nr:hypothetical protein [Eubacteriaceae bacterium]